MLACVGIYIALWVLKLWRKKKKLFWMAFLVNTVAMIWFGIGIWGNQQQKEISRNSYGEGNKIETFEASIEGEFEEEIIEIQVGEREYSKREIKKIFKKIIKQLDEMILGKNKSRDRVEYDLNLINQVEGYPVEIQWELDSYEVLDYEGKIKDEKTTEEGTLVEVKGILSYGTEQVIYMTHVMVYPRAKSVKEMLIEELENRLEEIEKNTKKDKSFFLPNEINGKQITWRKKDTLSGYSILLFGGVVIFLLVIKERQDKKEEDKKKEAQMIRDYPDIISKFTLLLGTGMTIKNVWTKVVQNYEKKKNETKIRGAYEEMCKTLREMQSGVPETEAYERFGKRCGLSQYMKFGAMLSQNVKKGSKGFVEQLKLESIQAFEQRKSIAKKLGEEASTKLLLPMLGMLAVVMLMVIVPAFLSIQI